MMVQRATLFSGWEYWAGILVAFTTETSVSPEALSHKIHSVNRKNHHLCEYHKVHPIHRKNQHPCNYVVTLAATGTGTRTNKETFHVDLIWDKEWKPKRHWNNIKTRNLKQFRDLKNKYATHFPCPCLGSGPCSGAVYKVLQIHPGPSPSSRSGPYYSQCG